MAVFGAILKPKILGTPGVAGSNPVRLIHNYYKFFVTINFMNYDPEYLKIRNTINFLSSFLFKNLKIEGIDNIKKEGGLLAPNHPSWKDIVLLSTKIPQQIYFAARGELFSKEKSKKIVKDFFDEKKYFLRHFDLPVEILSRIIPSIVKGGKAIGVSKEDDYNGFYKGIEKVLLDHKLACIFPGGGSIKRITNMIKKFQPSISQIVYDLYLKGLDVPVYPCSIFYSLGGNDRLFFDKPYLNIGKAIYIKNHETGTPRKTIINFTKFLQGEVYKSLESLETIIKD